MQGWVARAGQSLAVFERDKGQLIRAGFRTVSVTGYELGGEQRVDAIWLRETNTTGPAWEVRVAMTAAEHEGLLRDKVAAGWRPTHLHSHSGPSGVRFAAIYDKPIRPPEHFVRHGMTPVAYQQEFDRQARRGLRVITVCGYIEAGEVRYAALWEKRSGAQNARHGLTRTELRAETERLAAAGWRPTWINAVAVGSDGQRFAVLWEKTRQPWLLRSVLSSEQYLSELEEHRFAGYRPAATTVVVADTEQRTALWHEVAFRDDDVARVERLVDRFRATNAIPGVSVAIAKHERLVFARGYGWAEQDVVPMGVRHRLRIASVSKPITAVAILSLVQSGALRSLDQRVFGPNGLLAAFPLRRTGADLDRLQKITARQLLQHVAGAWGQESSSIPGQQFGDPMFDGDHLGLGTRPLIQWVLDQEGYPVGYEPGGKFVYSNFGYCLLGRVIEALRPGAAYEDYVRTAVLAPIGAGGLAVGKSDRADRLPDEVVYYGGDAYQGIHIERHDANGGWIARPIDLLRFSVRVDGSPRKPDILRRDLLEAMETGSAARRSYGLGWGIKTKVKLVSRPTTTITFKKLINHQGALPGTRSILAETERGVWIAIIANGNGGPGGDIQNRQLAELVHDIENAIGGWPVYDLF